jgi:hypothetical protein
MDEFDEQIRIWKIRVEQINRTLSHPGFNPASREGYQLIEEKQKFEGELANVEGIREARRRAASVSVPGESDTRPPIVGSAKSADATLPPVPASRPIERGQFCQQVIDEIRRIKNLHLGSGMSIAEIQNENPKWAAWNVRESLSSEDRETFNHPRRWGAPVGYARLILSKDQAVTVDTVRSWVKAYRRSLRMRQR